jgi:hypothetical protein
MFMMMYLSFNKFIKSAIIKVFQNHIDKLKELTKMNKSGLILSLLDKM